MPHLTFRLSAQKYRLALVGVVKLPKNVLLVRLHVLLLADRFLKLPDVMLGLADAEKELGQSLVEHRPHAADQEFFPDVESVHQLAKLIIGLELLLPLPFGRSRALFRP